MNLEEELRGLVAPRCGGRKFDRSRKEYSFSAVLREERALEKGNIPEDPTSVVLPFSVADPRGKMTREAMVAGWRYYEESIDATRYKDTAGIRKEEGTKIGDTHEGICAYLKKRNPGLRADFDPRCVKYSSHGIKGGLGEYVPTLFFTPKDLLIFPEPGYGVIAAPENNRGIKVFRLQLKEENGWKIPITFVPPRRRNIFLYLNTPQNPTGAAYSREELVAIISWARENGVFLIVDEAYDWIRFDDSVSFLNIKGWEEVAMIWQSVSKGWNATGARFAWVVAHPTLIKAIDRVMDKKDSGIFGPTAASCQWCLEHLEIAEKTNQYYRTLHQKLAKGLQEAGFQAKMPSGGLCQFVKSPEVANDYKFKSAADCAQWLRKKLRVSVMHYTVEGQGYLRWAVTIRALPKYGLPTELSVIEEAVRRLQEVKFEF